jgi:DNA-binding NarL/FixJ family response regulator
MRSRAIVVAHREEMVAEGIAAAIGRYPGIVTVAVATSTVDVERQSERADAVALDARLPGAEGMAARLRRRGVRVVFLGEDRPDSDDVRISLRAPVARLVAALAPGAVKPRPHPLTEREREVLALVSKGLAAKQVAHYLGISPKTVERHKTRIFAKLGVPNQAAAVSAALADGLVGSAVWT